MQLSEESILYVKLIGVGSVVLVVLLVGRWFLQRWATRDERELEAQLQAALAANDLRRAGDLQVRRGLYREAARIFERANDHLRAARALEKTGDDKATAEAFLKAGERTKAGGFLRKAGDHAKAAECFETSTTRIDKLAAGECWFAAGQFLKAARIFQDVEEYERAADAFGKVDPLDPPDHALTMLEVAAIGVTDDVPRKKAIYKRAGELASKLGLDERAAKAFDEAGELKKAAELYERTLKKPAVAAAIYAELNDEASEKRLTEAAGGAEAVLSLRESRARARGETGRARRLAADLAKLRGEVPEDVPPSAPVSGDRKNVEPAKEPAPKESDRFELLGELGRGSTGVVHKARDVRLGRMVALKVLPDELAKDADVARLFREETRAAAALSHPGIVTVYDVGELDGRDFIAMELLEGTTLDRLLEKSGPLSLDETFEVMRHVLEAVGYAHEKGVIHRDLKPRNLMRTRSGVKVMDFGLAKVSGSRTPAYLAPEELAGSADHRADVFSLGVTFYELVTGTLPGSAGEPASKSTSYPTVRDRVPSTPPRLSDLIMRCLEQDKNLRPQDVVGMVREVTEIRDSQKAVNEALRMFVETGGPVAEPAATKNPASATGKRPAAVVDVVEERGPRGRDNR